MMHFEKSIFRVIDEVTTLLIFFDFFNFDYARFLHGFFVELVVFLGSNISALSLISQKLSFSVHESLFGRGDSRRVGESARMRPFTEERLWRKRLLSTDQ